MEQIGPLIQSDKNMEVFMPQLCVAENLGQRFGPLYLYCSILYCSIQSILNNVYNQHLKQLKPLCQCFCYAMNECYKCSRALPESFQAAQL